MTVGLSGLAHGRLEKSAAVILCVVGLALEGGFIVLMEKSCTLSCPRVTMRSLEVLQTGQEVWWILKLSGSESMESVDHNADCPMQLFFYELQMAVTALLKQINTPRHQVLGFTILSPFYDSWKLS